MPTLEIPLYKVTVGDQEQQRYAFHMVKSEQEKQTAIAELQRTSLACHCVRTNTNTKLTVLKYVKVMVFRAEVTTTVLTSLATK